MTATPLGDSSPADRVPVVELAKVAGMAPTHYYELARRGLAPKSQDRAGVLLTEAVAWLDARAARKTARDDAVKRLRAFYAEGPK